MAFLIDYIWQSTFCLLFFYGIYWVFLRNEKVFRFTRAYILITPILALLFPILRIPVSFVKPDISLEQSQLFRALTIEQVPEDVVGFYGLPEVIVKSTKLPTLLEFKDYFLIFYIIIISLLTVRLLWQVLQIRLIKEKGWYQTIFKLKGNYFLIPTFGLAPIFSFFNQLYWDETHDLTFDEKEQIIKHEIEHIRQGHSWDVLYYQILSIVIWFNPAIHLMRIALIDIHEYLADESVLKQTINKESYPKLIVKIAFKGLDLPIGNYFIRSTTLKRILMMKKSTKPNWFKMAMIVPLTLMLLALVSMKTSERIGSLFSFSTERIEIIKDQLIASQDSLEVAIKVKKTNNPKHYELIGPLEGDKLTAQLGELIYEFSEISSDNEYLKVRSLINTLRSNSRIVKNYGSVKSFYQATKKPTPIDGNDNWYKHLTKILNENLPKKEKELGIASEIEIEFMISKEGKIINPVIKRSFGGGVDDIILQELVSTSAPKWNAGEINGEKVDIIHSTYLQLSGMISSNYDKESLEFFPQVGKSLADKFPNVVINEDTIFDVVEIPPSPEGGMQSWNEYLKNNLTYPEISKVKEITGTVYLSFVIDKSGRINDVQLLRGVSQDIDEEAIRVVQDAPNWISGKQNGKDVNVRMRMPIRFKKNDSTSTEIFFDVTTSKQSLSDEGGWSSPSPKGGMDGWIQYLSDNLKYPKQALEAKQEGTIYLTFLVTENGSVENVELLRGVGYGIDEEALRLVKEGPKWIPSKKDDEVTKSRMRLPIVFELDKAIQTTTQARPNENFNKYISRNIKYPIESRASGHIGTVIAKLTLDENGKITQSAIEKGVSKELDAEVLQVLTNAPAWEVNKKGWENEVLIPITFRMNNTIPGKKHNLPNEIVVFGHNSQANKRNMKPDFDVKDNVRVGFPMNGVFQNFFSPTTISPIYIYEGKVIDFDSMVKLTTEIKTIFTSVRNPSKEEIEMFGDGAKKGLVYVEKDNIINN